MFPISIDLELNALAPDLALGVISASSVEVTQNDVALWGQLDGTVAQVQSEMRLEELPTIPEIKALREAYRTLGKDPSRYRGSQEALLRRILQGKGLYKINTVVDINNLVSLESRHSVGSYNMGRLKPPIVFRKGKPEESYKGIGKETINIAGLPVFADELGPFGSPTSDSERAMITTDTQSMLMVIISFTGSQLLCRHIDRAKALLSTYAKHHGQFIETAIIK